MSEPVESSGLQGLTAPAEVVEVLRQLIEQISAAAGDNLVGIILYGGLARGRYRPGKSDVNLAIVLKKAGANDLNPLAEPLRAAWRAARVEPFLLAEAEIEAAADVFPTKFKDIASRHRCLSGDNPFARLRIDRRFLALRVEQELRNLTLRLRRRYISASGDAGVLVGILSDLAPSLEVQLRDLLPLAGLAADDERPAIFERAAHRFGLDGQALQALDHLYYHKDEVPDPYDLYGRILDSLEKATDAVEAMEQPGAEA